MEQIDRHFIKATFLFLTFISMLVIGTIGYAPTVMAADPAFTISDVHVDVTSDNAAKAREEAFAKAQYNAFQKLANRLLSKGQISSFEMPNPRLISTLINDFEVTNEQLSTVRYVGTYTFRFKDSEVRRYLNMQNMSFTDVASKAVLVLPFYQTGSETVLWDDSNLWMKAWARNKTYQGLVPVLVPIGDLQDVSDIEGSEPLDYHSDKMAAMIERYNAREAIIVIAAPQNVTEQDGVMVPSEMEISIYEAMGMTPRFIKSIKVENKEKEDRGYAMFDEGIRRVQEIFQDQWKNKTVVDSSYGGSQIKARVHFASMQEWVETQNALQRVRGVNETKLLSLSPRSAELEIVFNGTEDRLRLALSQSDMTLSKPSGYGLNQNFQNNGTGHNQPLYNLYLDKFKPR